MPTRTALTTSLMLLIGCAAARPAPVIPDPSIPHRVAAEVVIPVWLRNPDGKYVKQDVRILEGWWVASPQVVERPRQEVK